MNKPVSFVIPAYNAENHIEKVVMSIINQSYDGEKDIIAVNDGSTDKTGDILREIAKIHKITIVDRQNKGAVIATNNGFSRAKHEIICSIDSDVVLSKDWLKKIMEEFESDEVAAVQGYYKTPPTKSFWAKMMGFDVEARYDSIKSKFVTQVCTGNTAYRKTAIDNVGLFDPIFVYGYDNDMSYRLVKAGYKLSFRKDAICDHYWKETFSSYVKQQYNSAFGRMQLIRKHKERVTGDSVSGIRMIMQVPLTLLFLIFCVMGFFGKIFIQLAFLTIFILMADRFIFSLKVFSKQKDFSVFLLPLVHLIRNFIWCRAFLVWIIKKKKVEGK